LAACCGTPGRTIATNRRLERQLRHPAIRTTPPYPFAQAARVGDGSEITHPQPPIRSTAHDRLHHRRRHSVQQIRQALARNQKLAETVRTRLAINSRATTLAGEAKVSAIILTALPFIAGLGLSVMRPGYLDPLFKEPQGRRLLTYAELGTVLGILAMRQLILSAVKE
jgi:hypothetical protein